MITNSIAEDEWEEGLQDGALISGISYNVQAFSRHESRFVVEGDRFGVEPVGFAALMNFSKARHVGLELSKEPGTRKAAVVKDLDEVTPEREYIPQGEQRADST